MKHHVDGTCSFHLRRLWLLKCNVTLHAMKHHVSRVDGTCSFHLRRLWLLKCNVTLHAMKHLVSLLKLTRLTIATKCLLHDHVNSRTTAESPECCRLSSWVCHHVSSSWFCRHLSSSWLCRHVSSSWLCWCSKYTLASVLSTSEMPWCWLKTAVDTVCTLPTPRTALFHERWHSLGRELSVLLHRLFGNLSPSSWDRQTSSWVLNGSSKHTFLNLHFNCF